MNGLPGYDAWKLAYPPHWDHEPCEYCDDSGHVWELEPDWLTKTVDGKPHISTNRAREIPCPMCGED